ncbi:MAG: cation diffusion facilitator family transporter [Chitinophagales bacterium]|nr:cation diffusion facilitator family transporter [Chitinophagales bacterium]MCZ2392427.1 cation diffusion facilitator family transporter [Chitinophagales bacterium]
MKFQFHKNDKINTQWYILILGIVLMTLKFIAYYHTHSNAILSDALESIVNIIAGGFGLYSLYLSAKPRDFDHPYGHGKIEFISSSIEGGMILFAGMSIALKAMYGFFRPSPLNQLDIGILLVAISGLLNYCMGVFAVNKGQKKHSLALEASGIHLKTDAYTTLGVLIGLAIIHFTGFVILDNVIALLMSILIIFNGYRILKKSMSGIMDEADFELNTKVIHHINSNRVSEWIDVHNFRIIKYGEVIHIDCHMTMPWYYSLQQAHDGMKEFEKCLQNSLLNPVETFIHIDPCVPQSCSICQIANCAHRTAPFKEKIEWTLDNITKNQKHHYNNTISKTNL